MDKLKGWKTIIGSLTGVAMRLGIKNEVKAAMEPPKQEGR